MAPPLKHPAATEHDDLLGVAQAGQAMRDHQQRAPGRQHRQGLLDGRLGLRVGRGGGFVQHQDGGIGQQRAGDGQALPLAAGQRLAAVQHGGVALGQLFDARVDLRGPRRGPDLVEGGLGPRQAQVVQHAGAQQADFLENEGDLPVQGGGVHLAQVHTADADGAAADVGEARQQAGQRRLAGAGLAHQGGQRARRQHQVDAVQGQAAVGAPQAHRIKAHFAALGLARPRRLRQGRGGQQFANAPRGLAALDDGVAAVPQRRHGRGQRRAEQGEGQQLYRLQFAGQHQAAAGQQHQGDHQQRREQYLDAGAQPGPASDPGGEEAGEVFHGGEEGALHLPGTAEGLDHGDALDEAQGRLGQAADGGPQGLAVGTVGGRAQRGEAPQRQQRRQQHHQGHAPVLQRQVGQAGSRRHQRRGQVVGQVRHQVMQGADVVHQHPVQPRQIAPGVPSQGQAPEMGGQAAAQVQLQVAVGQVGHVQRAAQAQQAQQQRGGADQGQERRPAVIEVPGEQRRRQFGQGHEGQDAGQRRHGLQRHRQQQAAAHGAQQRRQGEARLSHARSPPAG